MEDNTQPWSGDHCIDFTKVPGVVLSNYKIHAEHPALTDIAPTILHEFGIATPDTMKGRSIFDPSGQNADRGAPTPNHLEKSH